MAQWIQHFLCKIEIPRIFIKLNAVGWIRSLHTPLLRWNGRWKLEMPESDLGQEILSQTRWKARTYIWGCSSPHYKLWHMYAWTCTHIHTFTLTYNLIVSYSSCQLKKTRKQTKKQKRATTTKKPLGVSIFVLWELSVLAVYIEKVGSKRCYWFEFMFSKIFDTWYFIF